MPRNFAPSHIYQIPFSVLRLHKINAPIAWQNLSDKPAPPPKLLNFFTYAVHLPQHILPALPIRPQDGLLRPIGIDRLQFTIPYEASPLRGYRQAVKRPKPPSRLDVSPENKPPKRQPHDVKAQILIDQPDQVRHQPPLIGDIAGVKEAMLGTAEIGADEQRISQPIRSLPDGSARQLLIPLKHPNPEPYTVEGRDFRA